MPHTARVRLYIGLLHYPVLNRHSQKIASAVTTVDLHDLARLARTYGVKKYFVITPLTDQQVLAARIISHWTEGFGAEYNPDRSKAIELVEVIRSLGDAAESISKEEGERPLLIATGAGNRSDKPLSFEGARAVIHSERVVMVLFGTAWGLEREVFEEADYILEPVTGKEGYNHLSVRSAAAVILDRLVGRC